MRQHSAHPCRAQGSSSSAWQAPVLRRDLQRCSTHTCRVCSRASAPYLLLVHLYPLKLFILKVFLGFLCFATKTPPKPLCPKRVNATGSSHVKSSSMQSCAGSGSPPALGEHTPLDRYFQFFCLQLFSLHLFGERQLHISKFSCIYNVSAWNRHSLS